MFLSKNKKIMLTPANSSFFKWGLRGPKLYRYVFVMRSNVSSYVEDCREKQVFTITYLFFSTILLCLCVGGFIYGIYFVIICSLYFLHLVRLDCGISWVASYIYFPCRAIGLGNPYVNRITVCSWHHIRLQCYKKFHA